MKGKFADQLKKTDVSSVFKGASKLQSKIIFVSATKIDENTANLLICCFSE